MAVSVETALDLIYKNVRVKATKLLPLEMAVGHVIAQDLIATHNLPPYDNSAMDGFAVKCADAGKKLTILKTILAGDQEEYLLQDECAYKIMTGAKIPFGTEAIIPIEEAQIVEDSLTFIKEPKHGMHIRLAGEDIECDDIIITKGTCLCAHHITLLASQGVSHVSVYAKPRVALFGSGSELKMHWQKLEGHQLYNTNTPTFMARAQELGCEAEFLGTAKDSIEDLCKIIDNALDYDLIITSGGVSVGDADFTKEAFGRFGFTPLFEKVDIKPGKPTTFGTITNTYVLNLPGNPLAATLNFELFAKAAILAMSGVEEKYIGFIQTKMQNDFTTRAGKRSVIPGVFDGCSFAPLQKFAPGMIMPLSVANGFIMIDESISELKAGAEVKFISARFSFTCKESKELITR